ncbi:hypothetical protein BDN70DRAFT_317243 [Pholiota conissans]|uniref:Uncharacterized protein n=1 Tax=Pholiota conissans TaxID=109636 RepID=A0A9P6CWW5_9AGAR|nr:hypothetical protein BDN70DRAFT_317243 [Pholiota conissans]
MESFDVGSFHGPLFLGYLFNTTLLGIIMTQGYLYYTTYKDDNWWIKGAVTALMVANIVNTTFVTAFLYQVLITFFNDPLQSIQLNWRMCFNTLLRIKTVNVVNEYVVAISGEIFQSTLL